MDFEKTNSKVRDLDLNIPYVEEEEDFDLNAANEFPLHIIMDTHQPSQNTIEDAANKMENEVQQSCEVETHVDSNSVASKDTREVEEVEPHCNANVSFPPLRITKRRRRPRRQDGFTPKKNKKNAKKGDNGVESSKVDTTIEPNSGTSEDAKHEEPNYIASNSSAPVRISRQCSSSSRRRRRRHRGGEVQQSTSDSEVFCTNYFCKTKTTPMWRKGPLGPRTLCNACGLQYVKTVKGKGSGKSAAVRGEGNDDEDDDVDVDGASDPDTVTAETAKGDSNM